MSGAVARLIASVLAACAIAAGAQAPSPASAPTSASAPAGAGDWRVYDENGWIHDELDAASVRVADGRVTFDYRYRSTRNEPTRFGPVVHAVVDCPAKRRSDVDASGERRWFDVIPGTKLAAQLRLACQLAGTPARITDRFLVQIPAGPAPPPPPTPSREDADALWQEAIDTDDGQTYQYSVFVFENREAAAACVAAPVGCIPPDRPRYHQRLRAPELPLAWRPALRALQPGDFSAPVTDRTGAWVLLRLDEVVASSRFERPADRVLARFAPGTLPSAAALRTDPALRARTAANRVIDARSLHEALASGTLDASRLDGVLSDGATLLVRAVRTHDLAWMEALVSAGADPSRCGESTCPVPAAVRGGWHDGLRWLLAHGASPALGIGSRTPLVAAAERGDRDAAELLIAAGADPLASVVRYEEGAARRLLPPSFTAPVDTAFRDWYARVVHDLLARQGHRAARLWSEQGGKRTALADGATIALARKPFRLLAQADEAWPLRIATSRQDDFGDRIADVRTRARVAEALVISASRGGDDALSVGELTGSREAPGYAGGVDEWAPSPRAASAPKSNTAARPRLLRAVARLDTADGFVDLAHAGPGPLHLLAGSVPPLGAGVDFFEPVRVTITLR